jgi:hypothetical protein
MQLLRPCYGFKAWGELETEGTSSNGRRWRAIREAKTEPLTLDAQSAGLPIGFRMIMDLGVGKQCWGEHRVGGGLRCGRCGCAGGGAVARVGLHTRRATMAGRSKGDQRQRDCVVP